MKNSEAKLVQNLSTMENFIKYANASGIEILEQEGNQFDVESFVIPENVISQINSTINIGDYFVNKQRKFNEKILKVDLLVLSPDGNLDWTLPTDLPMTGDEYFIVLVADQIICHAPTDSSKICKINLITPYSNTVVPKREKAPKGYTGTTPPDGGNTPGGSGGHGPEGYLGTTYYYPILYIFYNKFEIKLANPTITRGLAILGDGLNGGDGGDGGDGGNGARGQKGTDGREGSLLGVPFCDDGPGEGGNGGNSGGGGKGGKAGKGGDGVNIRISAPSKFTQYFEVYQSKGIPGNPGNPGNDGTFGEAGSFGSKPWTCTYPYTSKRPGFLVPNPNKTIGDSNIAGDDGVTVFQIRDNSDIAF